MRITRQSLSDKLLINNSWSHGVLSQEVRVCWGSPWCGQGLSDIVEATAMFAAHAIWPGWVWVWGGLFWFSAFVTCSSFFKHYCFLMFAPIITFRSQQISWSCAWNHSEIFYITASFLKDLDPVGSNMLYSFWRMYHLLSQWFYCYFAGQHSQQKSYVSDVATR